MRDKPVKTACSRTTAATCAAVVLMLAAALGSPPQAAATMPAGALGLDASRAVDQWPAAQQADPAWEWTRVLVFLVQTALIEQAQDPGKPDGLTGPKTMLALLAWSVANGPWAGDRDTSYLLGLDDNVAHFLHGTLESQGLAPGPKDRLLGPESLAALKPWNGTFLRSGFVMSLGEERGREYVMNEFGAAGPAVRGKSRTGPQFANLPAARGEADIRSTGA